MAGRSTGVSGLIRRPLPYLLVVGLLVVAFQYFRPLPVTAATPVMAATERIGIAPALPWPAHGAAALAIDGLGEIGSAGGASPMPMASTAKIMSALLILENHPLALNETGPVLTVTRADVATFVAERNQNQSVLPVVAGEQLTEYQLLQGLLLPSASNYGAMLAAWDQGSVPTFIDRMNARAAALGMAATHYADISGFSPGTVSIPGDLIKVARAAMRLPVFAQIVAQPQATLPVAGTVRNLNALLGENGVIGIKTGHTDQAGGCLVFAAEFTVDGQPVRLYGAVMGQPNALAGAFAASSSLLKAVRPTLHLRPVVPPAAVVAHYQTAWGESGAIVADQPVSWVLPDGATLTRRTTLSELPARLPSRSRVGTMIIASGERHLDIQLVTSAAVVGPDLGWRLTRGF